MVSQTTGLEITLLKFLWILLQLISACISFDSFCTEILRLKSSVRCYNLFIIIKQKQSSKDIKSNTFKIIFQQLSTRRKSSGQQIWTSASVGSQLASGEGNLPDIIFYYIFKILCHNIGKLWGGQLSSRGGDWYHITIIWGPSTSRIIFIFLKYRPQWAVDSHWHLTRRKGLKAWLPHVRFEI